MVKDLEKSEMILNKRHEEAKTDNDFHYSKEKKYGEESLRFFILASFCLLAFCNGMQWVTVASIITSFKKNFNLNSLSADMMSLLFMFIYPIVSPISSYIIDKKSVKLGIFICSFLTISGAMLKCLSDVNLFYLYLGQTLAAIAQPFFQNTHGKIAVLWFSEEKRTLVTSIGCSSNTLGMFFGTIFPFYFIDESSNVIDYKISFSKYLFYSAILNLGLCFPSLICFKSKPSKPSSCSSDNTIQISFKESFKMMLTNSNFIMLVTSQCGILGFLSLYTSNLTDILTKYETKESTAAFINGTSYIFSFFSVFLFSYIIDKNKRYKFTFLILNSLSLIFQLMFTFFLEISNGKAFLLNIAYISYYLSIFFTCPMIGCGLDLVCQVTFPIGESISGGVLLTSTQIFSILFILISGIFRDNLSNIRYLPNILGIICLLGSLFPLILFEENLVRSMKESRNKE